MTCASQEQLRDVMRENEALREEVEQGREQLRFVTVCDHCLCASCWQAIFMCEASRWAGTIELDVHSLTKLNRESPDYWREKA